jgi:hypothetical protein
MKRSEIYLNYAEICDNGCYPDPKLFGVTKKQFWEAFLFAPEGLEIFEPHLTLPERVIGFLFAHEIAKQNGQ